MQGRRNDESSGHYGAQEPIACADIRPHTEQFVGAQSTGHAENHDDKRQRTSEQQPDEERCENEASGETSEQNGLLQSATIAGVSAPASLKSFGGSGHARPRQNAHPAHTKAGRLTS